MKKRNLFVVVMLIMTSGVIAFADDGLFVAGRDMFEHRDINLRLTAGTVVEIEGMVQETTRAYYDASDQSFKQDLAEDCSLNDFGMESGYATVGMSFENAGSFFTFQFDALLMNPKVEADAQRNYYIGVGGVEYGGVEYDNMQIPEGTPFSMDLFGSVLEFRTLFTPFTIRPSDGLRITPWIDLGLFAFVGQYDVDAGDPTGVIQYLNPPEDFVVRGRSSGALGLAMPELGLGGQVRIGGEDDVNIVVQGHYSFFQYDGDTGWMTSTSHREKDIDLDHVNFRMRGTVEIPFESGRCFSIGAEFQMVESNAMITSQEATEEEILERRERFDKNVTFRMAMFSAMAGFTF